MKTQRIHPKKSKKETEKEKRRTAFMRLKEIIPRHVSLPLDGILCAASGSFHLDVFKLEKQIPNYNGDKCMYKGKPDYSMKMAIDEEWGKEASELIEILL